MTDNKIGFGVLGPLQMTVDGTPVSLGTPKQRAVLAVLVMNRNRPVAIDSLITAAWEQLPPPEARASLHSYISHLRKLLGGAGADSRSVLVNAPPGYRLAVADTACDIGRFIIEKAAGVQAAAAGRLEEASRHLSAALAEWRGPVLEDLRDFQFVDAFATALTEDKMVAHTARAEAEIACGRSYAVIGELESLTIDHPYREPLWAQLITAYYLAERQSDALDAYQRLKALLADDLGIDPGPTVRALHERILRQEPLDVKHAAKTTAVHAVTNIGVRTSVNALSAQASLRSASGRVYPLQAAATRIGRPTESTWVVSGFAAPRHCPTATASASVTTSSPSSSHRARCSAGSRVVGASRH
jgi:DNA-binding SARP family transcriptional activator